MALSCEIGFPYCVQVHTVPEKGEKEKSVQPLQMYHNLNEAITEFVKITHQKFGKPVMVTLYEAQHKKADDGVYEQDNYVISQFKVVPPKKVAKPKEEETEKSAE